MVSPSKTRTVESSFWHVSLGKAGFSLILVPSSIFFYPQNEAFRSQNWHFFTFQMLVVFLHGHKSE